jgi:hypothetical protein
MEIDDSSESKTLFNQSASSYACLRRAAWLCCLVLNVRYYYV